MTLEKLYLIIEEKLKVPKCEIDRLKSSTFASTSDGVLKFHFPWEGINTVGVRDTVELPNFVLMWRYKEDELCILEDISSASLLDRRLGELKESMNKLEFILCISKEGMTR